MEINSWRVRTDGVTLSTEELYTSIEAELASRQVPGLEISRVRFKEGGMLSGEREYLRLRRERLVFDVGASMFGNSWFCSCRFAEIPVSLYVWELLLILMLLAGVVLGYIELFGLIFGVGFFSTTLVGLTLLMRNATSLGLSDFDAWLLQVPVLSTVYEMLIRKNNSYYMADTRLMYVDIVDAVVRHVVNTMTAQQGVAQLDFVEAKPNTHKVLSDLLGHQGANTSPAPRAVRAKRA